MAYARTCSIVMTLEPLNSRLVKSCTLIDAAIFGGNFLWITEEQGDRKNKRNELICAHYYKEQYSVRGGGGGGPR